MVLQKRSTIPCRNAKTLPDSEPLCSFPNLAEIFPAKQIIQLYNHKSSLRKTKNLIEQISNKVSSKSSGPSNGPKIERMYYKYNTSVKVVLVDSSPSPKSDPLCCVNQLTGFQKAVGSTIYLMLKCMEGPANSRAQGRSRLRLMESLGNMI